LVERIYAEAPVYEEFVAKLAGNVRELLGPDDHSCRQDVGASATITQRDIAQRHVERAVARRRAGGRPTEGGLGQHQRPSDQRFAYAVPMGRIAAGGIGARAADANRIRKYCRPQTITSVGRAFDT
jgi:hypothetical protein